MQVGLTGIGGTKSLYLDDTESQRLDDSSCDSKGGQWYLRGKSKIAAVGHEIKSRHEGVARVQQSRSRTRWLWVFFVAAYCYSLFAPSMEGLASQPRRGPGEFQSNAVELG